MTQKLLAVCVAAVLSATMLFAPAHAELINHWKLDETSDATAAADSAGSLDAALQGDAQFVNDTTRGQVLSFDGTGDYASNTNEPFLSDRTHTVGVWVYHTAGGASNQGWISWGASGARYFIGIYSSGEVTDFPTPVLTGVGNNNNCRVAFGSSTACTPGTWEYWTIVRDLENTSLSLYRNGTLLQAKTDATYAGTISTSGELTLGKYYSGECFNGMMSDMAIWDEALNVDQIQNAMTLGAENYQVPEPSSAALLLIAILGGLAVLRLRQSGKEFSMTPRLFAVFVAAILSATILSGASNAELLVYEPFNYSGTDISAGSSGVWTDHVSLTTPKINEGRGTVGPITLSGDGTSLDYPGPGATGGARVADSGGGTASRALGAAMNLNSDNTYYASMLIRGSGILQFYAYDSPSDQYYVRTYLGITDTGEFIVGSFPNLKEDYASSYSNGTYDSEETYLLVAKIDANLTGTDDVFSLKVYDESMTPDLTEPTSFDLIATNGSGVNLAYMLIGMYDGGEIDEIRVGTTWGDVISVPEPATTSLLFAAIAPLALATLRFRRRRREAQP